MGKKLYVGNLSFSVTEQMLQSTFAQHGTDRGGGRSGGNRW